jgi:hypothetical protein
MGRNGRSVAKLSYFDVPATIGPEERSLAYPEHSSLIDRQRRPSAPTLDEFPGAWEQPQRCEGIPALPARLEAWMVDAMGDGRLASTLQKFGSPINLLSSHPMRRNIDQLNCVAVHRGLDFRAFFARKSNKCILFVDEALACGTN